MTLEDTLQAARSLLEPWAKEFTTPEPDRIDVILAPDDLLAAVGALHGARWGYLSTITGLDQGVEAGLLDVLYHFCSGAAVVTLRVAVPRENASVPSLFGIIKSVSFYERELSEMLGVTVVGTPNTDRLFLPDDWPDGVYPLRKDFQMDQAAPPEPRKL